MLQEKKIVLEGLTYGDVCKRSRSACVDDLEFQEFEEELLAAISEEE